MIEVLLQAERELNVGMVDGAERLFSQVLAADPRNGIALVGLARVALERADEREAYRLGRRALALDPENVAAQRLVTRLAEVFTFRGETIPPDAEAGAVAPERGRQADGGAARAEPPRTLIGRLLRRRR